MFSIYGVTKTYSDEPFGRYGDPGSSAEFLAIYRDGTQPPSLEPSLLGTKGECILHGQVGHPHEARLLRV